SLAVAVGPGGTSERRRRLNASAPSTSAPRPPATFQSSSRSSALCIGAASAEAGAEAVLDRAEAVLDGAVESPFDGGVDACSAVTVVAEGSGAAADAASAIDAVASAAGL